MEPIDRVVAPRRALSRYVIGVAILAICTLFGILAGHREPPHVAFYDSCLLVAFPVAWLIRRRR